MTSQQGVNSGILFLGIDGLPLGLLGSVDVVLLGKLEVTEELGVHALHLELQLGGGLPGRVAMVLPVLVVVGVVL